MTETIGFDEQTRSLFPMDAFHSYEKGTELHALYDYWRSLPIAAYGLPHQDSCRPERDLEPQLAERVSWIDTGSTDPLHYFVRKHAASTIPGFGVELSGKPLCDRPELDMDTTACAVEFLFCKHERTPMYHEIEQVIGGLKRHYTRIMLPFENDVGDVERIVFATRALKPAKRITFHVVGDR